MRSVVVLYTHPYQDRSRAGRALIDQVRDLPGVSTRALYDLYPDFAIDVAAEKEALLAADVVVWQCPIYWYSVPPLLALWFEKVLERGWAYGDEGTALQGKTVLLAVTTGGGPTTYRPQAMHGFPFGAFLPPIEQTARFCGMEWEEPFILHDAHIVKDSDLAETAQRYRRRIEELLK